MIEYQDGDVIFIEKYGSSNKERYYVKKPRQTNLITVERDKIMSEVGGWLSKIFLPQGYPDSVSKDYINYQIWDTAQAFCSTITGILATQEVLKGVGVGDVSATPLSATVTWVLKDGCGHVGKILFAFTHGTYLDAYSKKWRLYADTLNDAAMCIEIALPLFKNYTTFALCVSTVMKAIVGVAGGATRAAMTQHHAVRGNMADVSAKDSSQETAVNLIASLTALLIITGFGNSLAIFSLMMVLHIVFNYFAVRAVCLRTFNEPRFLQMIDNYLKKEIISSPCEINKTEPIVFYQIGTNILDLKTCGFKIKLGCSLKKIVDHRPLLAHFVQMKDLYNIRKYILVPDIQHRHMYVLIKEDAKTDDVLCAYCHAIVFSVMLCAINYDDLEIYGKKVKNPRPFAKICHTIQTADWSRVLDPYADTKSYFEPTSELVEYVDNIVQKEWRRVKPGLLKNGWDLSKHLLMTDEWRLNTKGRVKHD